VILHAVLFRWVPGTTDAEVDRLDADLRGLAASVEGVVSFETARDGRYRVGAADFALIARFADEGALRSYLEHPAHHELLDRYARAMTISKESVQAEVA
jgi:hypothetical protein